MSSTLPALFTFLGVLFQGVLMSIDEFKFHRKRKLGSWESWGHPLDSIFYLVPLLIAGFASVTTFWGATYSISAVASLLIITKDEWIHSQECEPIEHFLHALLFVVHPSILFGFAFLWVSGEALLLRQAVPIGVGIFGIYQLIYWARQKADPKVDNSFYEGLGDRWYDDDTHAIALLRVEAVKKVEYVREILGKHYRNQDIKVLDVGCGAGFISNPLAAAGYEIKGIDFSESSVRIAERRAPAGFRVSYEAQDAYCLQEPNESRDVVLMLDFLEHVEEPRRAIAEAVRVLKPGGILLIHTFNRTLAARLLAIHGIAFVAKDCPPHVHVYSLFIKPKELEVIGKSLGLQLQEFRGIRPKVFSRAFFWSVFHRRVHPDYSFVFSSSLDVGYLGYFKKEANASSAAERGRK